MTNDYVRKTIKLNKKLWNTFQKKIEKEYGTTYKHTSEEIEKAIENYVDEDVTEIEKTKTKINNLNDENKNLQKKIENLESENKKLSDELLQSKTSSIKNTEKIDKLEKELITSDNENRLLSEKVSNLEREVKTLTESNEKLTMENSDLETKYFGQVEETNHQIKEYNKIKNKREHAQERLNKTQDELNDTLKRLERYSFAIGQVKNMSFIDRLFNRLPEEIKELQPGKSEDEVEN